MQTYAETRAALTSLLEAADNITAARKALAWAQGRHIAGELLLTDLVRFEREAETAHAYLAGAAARYAAAYEAALAEEAAYLEATGR